MAQILITGGTGSFGSSFARKFHKEHQLTVFSRDETKQHAMRLEFPDVRYEIGDVRDRQRVGEVMKGQDYVFHAAALKQVPSCEFFPLEAVKTNILGTDHVLDAARACGVKKAVCLSTDKAVYPINAMGMSKAMMEKIAISKGAVVTRYGNVMRSRGSVIPLWVKAIASGEHISITDQGMTRFLLSLNDSIDLVMYALEHGQPGDTFVKKAPACTMQTLAIAMGASKIRQIGIRHGEKMHETLVSQEEMLRTEDCGDYFRVAPDSRDLNYDQYFVEGQTARRIDAYTSDTTIMLDVNEVRELLCTL
jgi:UDP-N-acetylglucosamine 4,6-dehydratase